MKQIARNRTDVVAGFLKKTKYLIHDRDPFASSDIPNPHRLGLSPSRIHCAECSTWIF